jgi:hypothetical protein
MWERGAGELSKFMKLYGSRIVPKEDYFTFETIQNCPNLSIEGADYLGNVATETFEGEPWEVMQANGLVYDFERDEMLPKAGVSNRVSYILTGRYYVSQGLIVPGSLTQTGDRILSFTAWYDFTTFKYSEIQVGDA